MRHIIGLKPGGLGLFSLAKLSNARVFETDKVKLGDLYAVDCQSKTF